MNRKMLLWMILLFAWFQAPGRMSAGPREQLSGLQRDQQLADFRVANLYCDQQGKIIGAKFWHVSTGAPIFLMQIETVPQVFMWIDTPDESNRGLPHSLEHLLAGKGTKGRYFTLLRDMRLSQSAPATDSDFNFYGLSSGTGMEGFFELFHALLDALYHPDFTDAEAEREFYHFGVATDSTKRKTLIEKGSVYDEMQINQGRYTYYYELNKRGLGERNPFAFDSGGVPNEMRGVTPDEIRRFHAKHYKLGSTTGFIFVIHPKENVFDFLRKISVELQPLAATGGQSPGLRARPGEPKYPIHPSDRTDPQIYPFAGASDTAPGFVHFAWKPARANSLIELRLLQLFLRGFAEGEQSLLHKSIVDSTTRSIDSGATGVDSELFLKNSPDFPVAIMEISGIPGNRISAGQMEALRSLILTKIGEVSQYSDGSPALAAFNQLVESYARASRRSESVWIRNAPGFGSHDLKTDWKEYLESLEMDPSFTRSLSEEPVWQAIEEKLGSGKNIWREVIQQFHLLEIPYAAAAAPSPELLARLEKEKQERIKQKTEALMVQYQTNDEQEALSRFQQDELAKTKSIDALEAKVPRPRFTQHPPLTPDDDLRYKQFELEGVPVISTIFDSAPTIDLELSFDLQQIPREYYKYLPILPRCFDSLGLKKKEGSLTYSELFAEVQREIYEYSAGYDVSAQSKRAEFVIRLSVTNPLEFRQALALIKDMMQFNYLDLANADRLRDVIARRLTADDSYTKGSQWMINPAYSFRNQDDGLFLALNSHFTWAHWNDRMKWLLHKPVTPEEINDLGDFANGILSSIVISSKERIAQRLGTADSEGVKGELIEYWRRNLGSFAESELIEGLRQLAVEVQQDLRFGAERTIDDLKSLQAIVLNRRALHIDLTLAAAASDKIRPDLVNFLRSIPDRPVHTEDSSVGTAASTALILARLKARNRLTTEDFPWYVGFVNPDGVTGSVIFYADFPDYSRLDHKSLIQVLASKLFAGHGPQSFYMKTREAGLAYSNSISSDPGLRLLWYYADRIPDIPSLVGLVNSMATRITELHDPFLVDYALRESFSLPRAMSTFSQRGRAIAHDIRDGNEPQKIRRFSEAILKLRRDPDLLSKITRVGIASIEPVLVGNEYKTEQRAARSIFFFVGPEKLLSDSESRLNMPKPLRAWPSDYWME